MLRRGLPACAGLVYHGLDAAPLREREQSSRDAMKRRDFTTALLGGAAALCAWPFAARAQQGSIPVVGFLRMTTAADSAHLIDAFRDGLKASGFVEGQNVAIEYRYAENHRDQARSLAGELIGRKVAVIATDQAVREAKAATSQIPILFVIGADPVAGGLVASLNRPGANVTGIVFFSAQLGAKRIELLRQLVPTATTIGVLAFPNSPEDRSERNQIEAAARAAGQQIVVAEAVREGDIDQAFASFAEKRVGAVLVGSGPFFRSHKEQITALAARHALPTSYSLREYVEAGGLMSYGTSIISAYRDAGIYAARILRGEKPADLPVMQATKFELVINTKTARTLGLAVPQSLLVAADDVIE
jgi:putative ABC transport system substrate-binding protein